MKKLFLMGLLSMVLATGGVFAQEAWGGKKNFASGIAGFIAGGARYERLLTPKISVGADGYWANSFIFLNEIEAGVFGRYYIWKGLYGELGLGFHIHSGVEDAEYEGFTISDEFVTTTGFGISPAIGWKFDPGKDGGFFLEPQVTVPITIGSKTVSYWGLDYDLDPGVGVGFVLALGLGWAF